MVLVNKIVLKNGQFILSLVLGVEGFSFLICALVALFYHEPITPFGLLGSITTTVGLLLFFTSEQKLISIANNRQKFILITFAWIMTIVPGTIPYLLKPDAPSFANALFESVSGFTCTGSSVISAVSEMPQSLIFWRSLTQWMGGFGTVLMVVQVFPFLKVFGNRPFASAIFSHDNSLFNFNTIFKKIFLIYLLLTLVETLLFAIGGIDFFKSICYAFGTISTGCFLPESGGLLNYPPLANYFFVLFMGLSGVGFFTFILIASGRLYQLKRKNDELKLYGWFVVLATLAVVFILRNQLGLSIGNSFQTGLFQAVSFITSSGYSITDYSLWPDSLSLMMIMLIATGGCLGSTSGGIKINRLVVLLKNFKLSLHQMYSTSDVPKISYNHETIDDQNNLSALVYISLFGLIGLVGILTLTLLGISPFKAVIVIVSALSTFGNNLCMDYSDAVKIIVSVFMLIGRLEIYPILLLLVPSFYQKGSSIKKYKKQ